MLCFIIRIFNDLKKLLYILLFVPFALFGQTNDPCYSTNNIYTDIVNQNPPLSIDLYSGWNLIGYPCSEPIDAEEAFSSIVEDIELVKDNNGTVYWPEFNFNGIGQLETLEGYQIYLNNLVVDFSFCSPIYLPDYHGCTDCESLNFNPFATLDDGSCNYDSDGDGVYDADEVVGCLDLLACNYNNVIGATDNGGCIFPEDGYNCFGNELVANVGDTAFGGIIFYIDYTGEHGLVAALNSSESKYQWGCFLETVESDLGEEIGSGYQNTINLVNNNCLLNECETTLTPDSSSYYNGVNAAEFAYDYISNGYDDWYLPSILELNEFFNTVGGIHSNHWSSTAGGANHHACMSAGGTSSYCLAWRCNSYYVRPVRSF